jgi:hypothetical protein
MPNARLAQVADLASLLELYRLAEVSRSAEPMERAERIWLEMLSDNGVAVFVSAANAQIVATYVLITAPNLLRAGRRHGFLENVVTHPEFRVKAMDAPSFTLRSQQPGPRIVTTSSFKAVEKTRACIASISIVASSRGLGSATWRAAPRNKIQRERALDRRQGCDHTRYDQIVFDRAAWAPMAF